MNWGQSWWREMSILDVLGEHIHEAMTRESMNIGKNQWQSVIKEFIYIVSKEIRKTLQSCEIPSWVFPMFSCFFSSDMCSVLTSHTEIKKKKELKILLNGFYIWLIHSQHFQKFSILNLDTGNSQSGLHRSYSKANSASSVVSNSH